MSGDWAGAGFSTPYADPDMDPAHARPRRRPMTRWGRMPFRFFAAWAEMEQTEAAHDAAEPEPEAGG
jgi:hypothetical protein